MQIPSGIFCKAMAREMDSEIRASSAPAMPMAMPSGMLWIEMPTSRNAAVLCRLELW